MTLLRPLLAGFGVVLFLSSVAAAGRCTAPAPPLPDIAAVTQASARLLAGLPPTGGNGSEISATDFWATHAAAIDRAWRQTRDRQLAPWRKFAEREVDLLEGASGPLYYPFSGPDFLYAHTLFPRAPRYLLVGLEEPGAAPRWEGMNPAQAAASLAQLRQSIAGLMRYSFFRTNSMKNDLRRGQLQGVAPVLMAIAALSGFEVRAVDQVHLDAAGALCLGAAAAGGIGGVRLALGEPGVSALRELVYLRVDLSDRALALTPQFERHVRALGSGPVLLKAASYLMHKSYFSAARNLVQERAKLVLQDDSGIPFQSFGAEQWSRSLYGSYARPIGMFRTWQQPKLRAAYAGAARPLDTGIGYSHQHGSSNLQLFEKRGARLALKLSTLR